MCFAPKRTDFTHKLTQWSFGRLSLSPPFRIPASLSPRIVREAPLHSFTAASFSTIREPFQALHHFFPLSITTASIWPGVRAFVFEPPSGRTCDYLQGPSRCALPISSFHEPSCCLLIYFTMSCIMFYCVPALCHDELLVHNYFLLCIYSFNILFTI